MDRKQRQRLGCVGAALASVLLWSLICYIAQPTIEPARPQNAPMVAAPTTGWSKKLNHRTPTVKSSYDVILEHKMTKDELLAIAKTLRDESVERNFVAFTLKGKELGVGWANFEDYPEPKLSINGVPKGHIWAKSKLDGKRLGPWVNEGGRFLVSIVEAPDGLMLEQIVMDGGAFTEPLKKKGERYIHVTEPEVYYIINGETLEAWTTNEGPRKFDIHYPPTHHDTSILKRPHSTH